MTKAHRPDPGTAIGLAKDADPEKLRQAAQQAARTMTACMLLISEHNPVYATKADARASGLPLCPPCWDRIAE